MSSFESDFNPTAHHENNLIIAPDYFNRIVHYLIKLNAAADRIIDYSSGIFDFRYLSRTIWKIN